MLSYFGSNVIETLNTRDNENTSGRFLSLLLCSILLNYCSVLTLAVKLMLHFLRLLLLKGKIGSGTRPCWWSCIHSESTCFCFSNCRTPQHDASWHTLSQSIRPHSGGAFRTFPQPRPSLSSWLAFTLFHRQLNIHKSSCSKRSAVMLPFFGQWSILAS